MLKHVPLALLSRARHDGGPGSHLARTVTHTPSGVTVTPVGKYGIVMRVTSLLFGSIRHRVPEGFKNYGRSHAAHPYS